MMAASALWTIFCLCLLIKISVAQNCIRGRSGGDLPSFQDYRDLDDERITRHHQAIIPNYKFDCSNQMCGKITAWGVDVRPDRGRHQPPNSDEGNQNSVPYTLDFQVWRPSPTVDDSTGTGCYSLVGNNRFNDISLSGGVAESLVPSSSNYIMFQPGDVLGVYVEEARGDNDGVVILNSDVDESFTRELVWYASIAPTMATSQNGDCPYSVGSNGVLNTSTQAAPVISLSTVTFPCPSLPSMATTQPTPPSNPTTSEQPVDPVDSLITTASTNDGTDGDVQIQPATDPEEIVTELRVPTTSETATDPRPVLRPSESTDIGLIIGIVVIVIVVIAAVVTVVIIITVLFKRHGNVVVRKTGALANPAYGTKGGVSSSLKMEYNTNADYDYIEDQSSAVVHQEAVPYHSTGPDVSTSTKTATKASQLELTGNESVPDVYEAPSTQKFRGASDYELPQSEDVFDSAGFYVPTADERAAWAGNHYELEDTGAYNKLEFFVEDQIYWAPASTTSDLYSQLASKKYREIPRNQMIILEELGSGQFGEVHKTIWTISGATKELAIKTLKAELPEEEKVRFLQEAAIMGQFSHPNVVKLYGVVTVGEPVMICLELLPKGDLRVYLCSVDPDKYNVRELELCFLRFSKQIASGMAYLSKKSFVHRDLAARNVLLDDTLNCKIGDFGMARDLMEETYYTPKSKGGKIPVKWTAPEALHYKKYSTDSDVWSYGMVLFEIWSVGKKPFSQYTNKEAFELFRSNYNQPPPPGCPRAIYKLMVDCWHPVHSKRPSFSKICSYLKAPNDQLLQWVDEESYSQRARMLGAPLTEAESLYLDLQNVYKDNNQ